MDIKLKHWAEQQLPAKSVEGGWECLKQEFEKFMSQARLNPDHDDIFDSLKNAVVDEAMTRHTWEDKVIFLKINFLKFSLSLHSFFLYLKLFNFSPD